MAISVHKKDVLGGDKGCFSGQHDRKAPNMMGWIKTEIFCQVYLALAKMPPSEQGGRPALPP